MKVSNGTWDVRCPDELRRLFPKRTGYYFLVDSPLAEKVLLILSSAYGIPVPQVGKKPKEYEEYALYEYDSATIMLRPRNHLKTVFHEFYHHLDHMTDGMYDSNDHEGGMTSFAWMFADKLWKEFTESQVNMQRRDW